MYVFFRGKNSKENNTRVQYVNEFVQNLGLGDPKTCLHQFICSENDNDDTKIIQFLLCMDWYYASN